MRGHLDQVDPHGWRRALLARCAGLPAVPTAVAHLAAWVIPTKEELMIA
jgi:hypothetical protein